MNRTPGRPGAEVWAEIWDEIAPMFEEIGAGGPAAYADDAPFVVERADGLTPCKLCDPFDEGPSVN